MCGSSPAAVKRSLSGSTPYTLNITQAAQQASLTATSALADSTVIGSGNNTFTVNVNGLTSDSLTLASGTYTPTALAQAVESAINGDATLNGEAINASVNSSNQLVLSSNVYGSASQVTMKSGTALSDLGFQAGSMSKGIDVAGNFVVNGQTEQATGSGQILTGNTGNANTAGIGVGGFADADPGGQRHQRFGQCQQRHRGPAQ